MYNYKIGFRVLCLCVTLLMITGLIKADNMSYVTLNRLAQKYNLRHEKDQITGREVFSGNGYNIVASSGMSTILVNNKLTVLHNKLESINGQLALSQQDFSKIEVFLKDTHKDKKVAMKGIIKKIVIDPGHGGDFRGCKSADGLLEKNVNLDVAKRLRELLEENGVKVVMTRTTDRHLSSNLNEDLRRRADIANREGADLLISIHCNWSNDSSVKGFEIYYSPENRCLPSLNDNNIGERQPNDRQTQKILSYILKDEYSKRSIEIAREIKKQFDKLPTESRGIRKANFKVIKYTECPSILIEMDFLSNKSVCANFHKESYRQEVSDKVKEAILSYGE
ncbi:MAG: N-acetylmuramoyl-L-alanine amidase [Planctomycetota bacterium]